MPQVISALENNFSAGLKTEFTGLNFPENAATDTDNCVYDTTGEVSRRPGIDFENNYELATIFRQGAMNTYKWRNVGGSGDVEILVKQIGRTLYFYRSSDINTTTDSLSSTLLVSTVDLFSFLAPGAADPLDIECQFADGNGYLFVFHPNLTSFYCTYNAGTITGTAISIQIRDFTGLPEPGVLDSDRPTTLTTNHSYNLINQGWGKIWETTSVTSHSVSLGSKVYTVAAGLPIVAGDLVVAYTTAGSPTPVNLNIGIVTAYTGTSLTINVTQAVSPGGPFTSWRIISHPNSPNFWNGSQGNWPSNADIWWQFKNSSGDFDPTASTSIPANAGPAAKGALILDPFNQQRSLVSGIAGIADVTTNKRPRLGTWFAGRVWYAGVDSTEFNETLFFSQIIENNPAQFGKCYQRNGPASEDLFDLLPSDGGTAKIQGCGSIYKLFPIQNGMLVFAANGIWFITGSQGIGFSANDYTITKISSVQCISSCSFVDVQGLPIFWNEDGIYAVTPSPQGGGLVVNNVCLESIQSFYASIPTICKKYARGDYNPLDFRLVWVFRDTVEDSVTTRYEFNRILNYNITNKSFYPYSISSSSNAKIHDVKYITVPGSANSPHPVFKYLTSALTSPEYYFTFSEEKDITNWLDFISWDDIGVAYTSYFVTGYKLHGKGVVKFRPIYVNMFSRNEVPTAYKIQGIWDYANSGNSGRYSAIQTIYNALTNFSMKYRKHKIRGNGLVLQIKVQSVDGFPFYIMGWASSETTNTGM